MADAQPAFSIIVPAYNEEKRISQTLSSLLRSLESNSIGDYEIIVVIDGNDNTESIVANLHDARVKTIKNKLRFGKGMAISTGLMAARGRIAGFIDADESVSSQQTVSMLSFLEKNKDLCGIIASRRIENSDVRKPTYLRRFFSFGFNVLVRLLLGLRYYDTQCGAKFFRSDFLRRQLPFSTNGFCIDIEVLLKMQKYGPIYEYPVYWAAKENSRFSLIFIPQMFADLLRIRFSS